MSLMTNFEICPTIRQTLFHGINFISRIKLKEQTENLKFQPAFLCDSNGIRNTPPPVPRKKKLEKKITIDSDTISFHFHLFYCLTNTTRWMETRMKLNSSQTLSRRKERKLVIRFQDIIQTYITFANSVQCKSTAWFLYECKIVIKRVNNARFENAKSVIKKIKIDWPTNSGGRKT